LRERDWQNLVWNVRRGRPVLFVGPDLGGGAESGTAALQGHLAGLLKEERREVPGQSLHAVAQQFEDDPKFGRSDLEREVTQFYSTHTATASDAEVQTSLAALPFPLCITTRHDLGLEQALRAARKPVAVEQYHFRGANPPVAFANAPRAPLLYYLHGTISDPPSLVLTERDLLEFLEKVVAQRPGLPDAIAAHLQKRDTTFLFVGFGLRHPYLRVLLYGLKVNQYDRSVAVEEGVTRADPSDDTVLFYERGKITLYDAPVVAFVAELARRFRAGGGPSADGEAAPLAVRPRVFISYASEDAAQARRLWDGLDRAGFDAWLDKVRLEGGAHWDPTIEQEIDRSDYVLVLQSRALVANVDSYVNKEIALARQRALRVADPFKCLIPLQIEPCEPRPDLASHQMERLGPEGYEDDLMRLVSLIKRDYQLRRRERVS
jgi:TIR domain/SIR2-like domain